MRKINLLHGILEFWYIIVIVSELEHPVVIADVPFFFLSFFSSSYSTFRRNLLSFLLSGNKHDRLDTNTMCTIVRSCGRSFLVI